MGGTPTRGGARRTGSLGKVGRAAGTIGRRTGRVATAPARAALAAAKQRRAKSQAAKTAARAAGKPVPGAWGAMRRFVRRNVLGHKDQPVKKPTTKQPSRQPTDRRATGAKVRRPLTHPNQSQRGSTPKPDDTSTIERNPLVNNQGGPAPQPTSHFWRSARELHANAVKFQPKGMIEVRTEAYELPHSLAEIASALRARAQECAKQPLHPNLSAAMMQVAACVESAAQASRNLGPAFDALHPTEVARILKPRVNEAAWDTVNNRP